MRFVLVSLALLSGAACISKKAPVLDRRHTPRQISGPRQPQPQPSPHENPEPTPSPSAPEEEDRAPPAIAARPPDVKQRKGIWITNIDSQTLQSRAQMRTFFQEIVKAGFNTIFPVVWHGGYTLFASPTAEALAEVQQDPKFSARDFLHEVVDEAHKLGLQVIPWFEWGTKVPFSFLGENRPMGTHAQQRGWLLAHVSGGGKAEFDGYQIGILNPHNAGVREFFAGMIEEVLAFDVEGIMFDDHLSVPTEFAHAEAGVEAWCQAQGCAGLNVNLKREKYFVDGVSGLVQHLSQFVRARGKKFVMAPGGHNSYTRKHFHVDWVRWAEQGLLDEVILQMYRDEAAFVAELFPENPNSAQREKLKQLQTVQSHVPLFGVGILTGLGKAHQVGGQRIAKQVVRVLQEGWGIGLFFDGSLFRPATGESAATRRCWLEGMLSGDWPDC